MIDNKNNIVDSVDTKKKEFDRSICFTFFESYLEQGELVNINLGSEACANYFIALCKYALYQEEPQDSIIKMLITGLKNTIDAGQNKRAKSFNGEDIDMTNKILEYKRDNPNASYRQIADVLGCSKSKVGKVLSNLNSNNNLNNNSNLNSNSNIMDVDVDTTYTQEEKKLREKEDLSNEELESIISDFKNKVKYKETQKRLNLKCDITKNTVEEVKNILDKRKQEENNTKIKAQISSLSVDDIKRITDFLNCNEKDLANNLTYIGVTAEYFLEWLNERECEHEKIFNINGDIWKEYRENDNHQYKTHIDFVKMGISSNPVGITHNFFDN